jgi:glycosyltransferase involved in cell wall biosynthesis
MGDVPPTHVVMLVANDVATDTRVKKEALALAQSGLRVTVLGSASEGRSERSWLGPVEIVRVPVEFVIRDEAARDKRRQVSRLLLDPGTAARVRVRIKARERAVRARSGLAVQRRSDGHLGTLLFKAGVAERQLERQALRGGRFAARVQAGLARRAEKRRVARVKEKSATSKVAPGNTGAVRWRVEHPGILDYEVAFGPVIDALRPDVLHAHDMHVVGIAAHARARARAAGREVLWVYDAHEYVPGLSQYGGRTARVIEGWADLEGEFIRDADRVITVSAAIADALHQRYQLASHPAVVLNIPTVDPPRAERVRTLREVCGLAPDVPLLSYSGGMTRARGVHTAIEAMTELADAHLGLVCVPHNDTWFVRKLRLQVEEMGLGERVHFVNPVGSGQVVDYLRGVDVGLIPLLSYPSHEMALPNKLFEYLHARVPVVSSELECLGAFLRETGVGVTFPAEDAPALAAGARTILADHERFAAAAGDPALLARYSWSSQAKQLRAVYDELLGTDLPEPEPDRVASDEIVDLTETDRPTS